MKRALMLCCLLLLTAASAAPGTLTAETAQAENAAVSADMAVLRLRSDADMGGGTATTFSLSATQVRVEVDRSDTVVDAIQRVYVMDYTTTEDHTDASITGRLRDNNDHEFVLGAWPGRAAPVVSWESECVNFGPSLRQEDQTAAEINRSRPPRVVPLDTALRPTPCGASWGLTIRGDFLLSVWGWSLTIDSDQGSEVVETGVERQDGATARAAEAFLFVTNGTLRVSLEQWSAFYVKGASVTADTLALKGAKGEIREGDEVRTLTGEDVELVGVRDTRLTGRGVGEALQVEVPPAGDFSPATRTPEASPLRTPQPLASLAAVGAAVGAGLFVRFFPLIYKASERRHDRSVVKPRNRQHRRGVGWRLMARTAILAGRPRLALRLARRAHKAFPGQPEVRLMVGKALAELGRHGEAINHFSAASGTWKALGQPRDRTPAVLGLAKCHVELGEPEAGWERFRELAHIDPDLARARLGSPPFMAFKKMPDYDALRHRLEAQCNVFQPTSSPNSAPDASVA